MSIKQCIEYANTNNVNIKNARYDEQIAERKVKELVGTGLPQIDASAALDDNVITSTTLLPAVLMGGKEGEFVAVKSGTQYNWTNTVQLTQKIYDPTFWVGLKAARVSSELSAQNSRQTGEKQVYNICKTYYQTIIIEKQVSKLKATLDASEKSLQSTELKFKNGLARKVDVDKIRVSFNNTKSQLQQSELNYKQSLNTLKYHMGMPIDSAIVLADTAVVEDDAAALMDTTSQDFVENRVDYQIQKTNIRVQELDKKRNVAGYIPSLSLTAKYNYQAMRQEINFFNPDYDWYESASIGLRLSVPIFDGLQKHHRVAQSKLNILKATENLRLTEQAIRVDVSNYEIQYRNAVDNIRNERENLDLAQEVYTNTVSQYNQGMGSSLDVVQAESSLREAQNTYYNKLFNLYIARLDLEQSKGNLMTFINKL